MTKFLGILLVISLLCFHTLAQGDSFVISQGCLNYTDASRTRCQLCSANVSLDDSGNCALYTPIQGCRVYKAGSSANSICVGCIQGYKLINKRCSQLPDNCLEAANLQVCDKCKSNTVLINFQYCYSTNITSCPFGTLPRTANGTSFCQKYQIINCQIADINGGCTQCFAGYTPINGICFKVNSQTPANSDSTCTGTTKYFYNGVCYDLLIQNCLSQSGAYCLSCNDLFYSNMGVCIQFIKPDDINCNLYDATGFQCGGCNLNFVLDSNYHCVLDYGLCNNGCQNCSIGFNLFNQECYINDPLCYSYDFTNNRCKLCAEGYRINPASGICQNIINCKVTTGGTLCQPNQCFTGFQYNTNTRICQKLPPNCQSMLLNRTCDKCVIGASTFNGACVFLKQNCTSYNSQGFCQTCQQGLYQVRRFCVPPVQNCLISVKNDPSSCDTCFDNYRNVNGKCYKNITGCVRYNLQQCAQCANGFTQANQDCYQKDVNCLIMDNLGLCQVCREGLLPFRSRCVYFDPFCIQYDTITLTCTRAMEDFSVSAMSSAQQNNYRNFVIQANSASRSNLASAFSESNGGSGRFNQAGIITSVPYAGLRSSSIATYTINGVILTCRLSFTLINNQCVRATNNCQSYNRFGLCQICMNGFDMASIGNCVATSASTCITRADNVCVRAASGYILIQNRVYPSSFGASSSPANNQSLSSYVDANGNRGYFYWQNQNAWWPLNTNCYFQLIPQICGSCQPNFRLVNGRCILSISQATSFSRYGLALACPNQYTNFAAECRFLSCNNVTNINTLNHAYCASCPPTYLLQTGICYFNTVNTNNPRCFLYKQDEPNRCVTCQRGFRLSSNNLCSQSIINCLTMSANGNNICQQCRTGFSLSNNNCLITIQNCLIYSSQVVNNRALCNRCNPGFSLLGNGTLCLPSLTFCATPVLKPDGSGAECQKCMFTPVGVVPFIQFVFNNTRICVRNISNCINYDLKANCISCATNFVLIRNRCKSMRCLVFGNDSCVSCVNLFTLNQTLCTDNYCLKADYQTCIECYEGYYLFDKDGDTICTRINDPNCLAAQKNTGKCTKCRPNFVVDSSGLCVSANSVLNGCASQIYPCPKCQIGYILSNGLCYARRCASITQNRDCQSCINYYVFDPSRRFCVLYNCASPACYESDQPPIGFEGNLTIRYCLTYNGANCTSCSALRKPRANLPYNLCYPINCRDRTLWDCQNNCLNGFSVSNNSNGNCVASGCSQLAQSGLCLTCLPGFKLDNSNGLCIYQIPIGCISLNQAGDGCGQCNTKSYSLVGGACIPLNCKNHTNGQCTDCIQGYILTVNKTCQLGKCAIVNQQGCITCLLGFYASNGVCFAYNCNSMISSTLQCGICNTGYELVVGVGICKPINCAQLGSIDTQVTCDRCITGYFLQNNICKSSNCLNYTNSFSCKNCIPGYNLLNGICTVSNCKNYSTDYSCILCNDGFLFQGKFCVPVRCTTLVNNVCTECPAGYEVLGGACAASNCQNRSITLDCLNCTTGFYLLNGVCIRNTVPRCISFNTNGICTGCEAGFILVNDGVNLRCDPRNCANISNSQCLTCILGFNLVNNVCVATNCNNRNINFECISCADKYYLQGNYCVSYNISNCVSYSTTGPCNACAGGYVLNGVGGIISQLRCDPKNCNQIVNQLCSQCSTGFTVKDNICSASNCVSFNNDYQCLNCSAGYYLQGVICIKNIITNCLQLDSFGGCARCSPGYLLIGSARCDPKNCISLSTSNTCLKCADGFNLDGGLCYGSNCLSRNIDFECLSCPLNFILADNTCKKLSIPNCINYTQNGQCTKCLTNYELISNKCVLIVSGCSVNSQFGCLQCNIAYLLSNGKCNPKGCLSVNNNGECLSCNVRYTLVSGLCRPNNCINFDSNSWKCLNCQPRFYTINDICMAFNCTTYEPISNSCLKCAPGYLLLNQTCTLRNCPKPLLFKCDVCLQNYVLADEGYCTANLTRCASYDPQSFVCLTCYPDFTLKNGLCQYYDVFCPNPTFNGTGCIECVPFFTYNLNSTQCQSNYCLSYSGTGRGRVCTTCATQFSLTVTSDQRTTVCVPLMCTSYVVLTGKCKTCVTGAQLNDNNFCVAMNCLNVTTINPISLRCLTCATDYTLYTFPKTGRTFCIAASCTNWNADYSCSVCNGAFELVNKVCKSKFCLAYNYTIQTCITCIPGYVQERQTCLPVGCNNFNITDYSCISCRPGYNLVNSNGIMICRLNQTYPCSSGFYQLNGACVTIPVSNCDLYVNNACINCLPGFRVFNFLCVSIQNCAFYSYISGCFSCFYGFRLENNFCFSLNCSTYTSNGLCASCLPSYQMNNSVCIPGQADCASYSGSICIACRQGFGLLNNLCYPLPQGCTNLLSTTTCSSCKKDFILFQNLCYVPVDNCRVYSSGRCSLCNTNFFGLNNRCIALLPGCSAMSSESSCSNCQAGFDLYQSRCYTTISNCIAYNNLGCLSCSPGWTVYESKCVRFDANCLSYQNGLCSSCKSFFYVLNSKCIAFPPNCQTFNFGLQTCVDCITGFVLVNNICIREIKGCSQYNSVTSQCLSCLSGYYLLNNICELNPQNCITFNSITMKCIKCLDGFIPNGSICIRYTYIQYCAQVDQTGQCQACLPTFFLKNNACNPYPRFCVTLDLLGNCISCAFGSQLSNGICIANDKRGFNCLTFDSTTQLCTKCMTGFTFCPASGVCLQNDQSCLIADNNGCTQCRPNYRLYKGQCLQLPPGVISLPNGGSSCRTGYVQANNSCVRDQNNQTRASTEASLYSVQYSSGSITNPPFVGSGVFWQPNNNAKNEYLSIIVKDNNPKAIFQVGLAGNGLNWVSSYVLMFRNKQDGPLICFDGCKQITGNSNSTSNAILQLYHPIVATQIRIYPTAWNNNIIMQLQLWYLSY